MEVLHHIPTRIESIESLLKESESTHGENTVSMQQKMNDELKIVKEFLQELDELSKSEELIDGEKLQLEKEIRNLQEKVAKLEEKLRQKDEEITLLNEKVERHETKLKEIESALQTGQIAFEFEKELAKYIYPHDKKFSRRKIFTNMKKWLEAKKDTPQGKKANEKWNALKDEFSWSSEHEDVFFKLLESRRKVAHPTLVQNEARPPIPDCFTDEEKIRIEDINRMIERLSELLNEE